MATHRNPYAVVQILHPTVTVETVIHYTASCTHTATSVRFVASPTIAERIAGELSRKPCSRCMERLPIQRNLSAWRLVK